LAHLSRLVKNYIGSYLFEDIIKQNPTINKLHCKVFEAQALKTGVNHRKFVDSAGVGKSTGLLRIRISQRIFFEVICKNS
jgi:hypothetical protein